MSDNLCHAVSIAIAASKILAATLKTAQQNDRESDSSKITHMHMDVIHTYERSSRQQFGSKRLTRHFITVSITMAASKILAATLKTAQQNDRESDSSKITHMNIDAIHTYERSTKQQFDSHGLQGVPSLLVSPSLPPKSWLQH